MKKLNRIAACAFGMALVIGVSSCSSDTVEQTNISETEITIETTKETEESEAEKETETSIVETTETSVEEVNIDLNEELEKFKQVIVTLSEENEDTVYSVRKGFECRLDDSDNYYLCEYSVSESVLRCYDSDGNLINEIMDYYGDYWGLYTADAILNCPVIMNSHSMGMEGIDDPTHQMIEDFSSDVKDGTYYGTILAISEDGKKALVSIGEPTIRSSEEIKDIELMEGGWATVGDGYVWIIEGSDAYYQTKDRFLTIIELADEVELNGDNYFKANLTGVYNGDYDEVITISDTNSILDTYFIEYSRSLFKEEYDGWIKTYADMSPVVISGGQIVSMYIH